MIGKETLKDIHTALGAALSDAGKTSQLAESYAKGMEGVSKEDKSAIEALVILDAGHYYTHVVKMLTHIKPGKIKIIYWAMIRALEISTQVLRESTIPGDVERMIVESKASKGGEGDDAKTPSSSNAK